MLGAVCAVQCVGDGAVLLAECQFQQRLPVGCLDVHTVGGALVFKRFAGGFPAGLGKGAVGEGHAELSSVLGGADPVPFYLRGVYRTAAAAASDLINFLM